MGCYGFCRLLGSSYNPGNEDFPAVPYSRSGTRMRSKWMWFRPVSCWIDFGDSICKSASGNIDNYGDINQVKNCKLVGLPDLVLANDYVSDKLADYMNRLIDIGVAGFRVDAAKHMWPNDLNTLMGKLKNLRSE